MKHFPRPNGSLQGDAKPMPDRGTGTGMSGHNHMLDGASIDPSATNARGGISGATKSDAADQVMPKGGK